MEERLEEKKEEIKSDPHLWHKIECMLFVAGDPVAINELARVLDLPMQKMRHTLSEMEYSYQVEGRGVQLLVTHDTAQLVNPDETKSVSQSLLETLAVIAYRQPVTRSDVERVRGVRCDYAVTQLQKLGLIVEVGRKDVVGHPTLFATTDKFLRQFGIHTVDEMPNFQHYSQEILEDSSEEIPVV